MVGAGTNELTQVYICNAAAKFLHTTYWEKEHDGISWTILFVSVLSYVAPCGCYSLARCLIILELKMLDIFLLFVVGLSGRPTFSL